LALAVIVVWAGCSFDPSGVRGQLDAAVVADADPNAPDADTSAPDADTNASDADTNAPDAVQPACVTTYTESFGSSLYRVGVGTWYEAQAACAADGARLVVIEDAAENAFVLSLDTDGDIFIGMSDHITEGTYVWLTGDVVMGGPYENWQATQPNDLGSGEDCGEMNIGGGWNDVGCYFTQTYVCECKSVPAAVPATWCPTRTDTDCDICGDDCTDDGDMCMGSSCGS